MQQLVYLLMNIVSVLLSVVQFLLFARAILSWLPFDEYNRIVFFLNFVTEPIIMPVRSLLEKMNIGQNIPIDLSFLVTFILISIIKGIIIR